MQKREIDTLKILEEIERDSTLTQRELSKKLNISLGLVNIFMKRLVQKGYFKIKTIPRNRVKYLLTPKGLAEKSRLTFNYLQYSLGFYNEIRTLLLNIFKQLEEERVRRIVFYGVGEVAELAYLFLQQTNIELAGVVDDNEESKVFFGLRVLKTESLPDLNFDYMLLTTLDGDNEGVNKLLKTGISENKIIRLKH
ncbi:MAG: winged helix-turn-helix transcriptional regulator [Pseudomonadota bacterium]